MIDPWAIGMVHRFMFSLEALELTDDPSLRMDVFDWASCYLRRVT